MADAFSKLQRIPEHLVETARASERDLAGSNTDKYLAHADAVADLTEEIRACGLPVKRSFKELGLDYTVARHAVWIGETLADLGTTFPGLDALGPSLVLFVREAGRRLEKEGRSPELPSLVRELLDHVPRDTVREKYLPPREPAALARVLAALRRHDPLAAHAAYLECADDELGELRLFAKALSRIAFGDTTTFTSMNDALHAVARRAEAEHAQSDSESP